MDDLTQTLLSFINNPENKEKIQKIKEEFMSSKSSKVEEKEKTGNSKNLNDSNNSNNGLPPISPEMLSTISKVMPLIASAKKEDTSTRFLSALRPLLNEKRKLKLDESVKIMHLIKILPMLKNNGIF